MYSGGGKNPSFLNAKSMDSKFYNTEEIKRLGK
jgi:hypothetical protein